MLYIAHLLNLVFIYFNRWALINFLNFSFLFIYSWCLRDVLKTNTEIFVFFCFVHFFSHFFPYKNFHILFFFHNAWLLSFGKISSSETTNSFENKYPLDYLHCIKEHERCLPKETHHLLTGLQHTPFCTNEKELSLWKMIAMFLTLWNSCSCSYQWHSNQY